MLNDATVSTQHATIAISDTGEVRVKDLNSKNGTYINGQRIYQETLISTKDEVKAGSSIVHWQKKLNAPKSVRQLPVIVDSSSNIKSKKTIGRNATNDIVVSHGDVSGTHAQLLQKENGDIVIADSGSTNGTYVNGQKISMQALMPGDTVLLANKHLLDWSSVFPKIILSEMEAKEPPKINKTKIIGIAAAAVLVFTIGIVSIVKNVSGSSPEKIFAGYKKSVVLIAGAYYFETSIQGTILNYFAYDEDGDIVEIETEEDAVFYTGTGFFVSNTGQIITNRHVMIPWEYDDDDAIPKIKNYEKKRLANSKYRSMLNELKVEGRLSFIGCFLNDSHINGMQDLIRCTPIKAGSTKDLDVALIQVNSKTLPNGVGRIVDLNQAVINDDAYIVGTPVFTIGFPAGFGLGMTDQGIEANNQDGKITQVRGDIEFGHNIASEHGASGSPIFNKNGKLVGILNAGYEKKQGYNMAIKARHAVGLVR